MICPVCDQETLVIDSRPTVARDRIRRRRECPEGHRCTTTEMLVNEGMEELMEMFEFRLIAIEKFILGVAANDSVAKLDAIREIIGLTKRDLSRLNGKHQGSFGKTTDVETMHEETIKQWEEILAKAAQEKLDKGVAP